jgi:hypothetical protein
MDEVVRTSTWYLVHTSYIVNIGTRQNYISLNILYENEQKYCCFMYFKIKQQKHGHW